jgi:hypothetical protein
MNIEEEISSHNPTYIYKQGNISAALTQNKLLIAEWNNNEIKVFDYKSILVRASSEASFFDPSNPTEQPYTSVKINANENEYAFSFNGKQDLNEFHDKLLKKIADQR